MMAALRYFVWCDVMELAVSAPLLSAGDVPKGRPLGKHSSPNRFDRLVFGLGLT
jgi:hypothetical protein